VVRRLYDPVRQVAVVLLSYYLAYGIAEVLELSGTLTLLFSALTIGHYGYCNLSKEARDGSSLTLEMLAGVADAFSFLYIGLSLAG
jgi:NhaP-type Na+/H+ or K+/H+ antiporter